MFSPRQAAFYPVEFRAYGATGADIVWEADATGTLQPRFLDTDYQGSERLVRNADGTGPTITRDYFAFGLPTDNQSADGRRVGYLSKEVDWESFPADEHRHGALSDLSARKYQPSKGAFITQDELWQLGTQAGTAHYSNHDPVNYSDPTGYNPEDGPLHHPLHPLDVTKRPKKDNTGSKTPYLRPHRGIPGGSQYTLPIVPSAAPTNPPSLPTDPTDPQYQKSPSTSPTTYESDKNRFNVPFKRPVADATAVTNPLAPKGGSCPATALASDLLTIGAGVVTLATVCLFPPASAALVVFYILSGGMMVAGGTTRVVSRLSGNADVAEQVPTSYGEAVVKPLATVVLNLNPEAQEILGTTIGLVELSFSFAGGACTLTATEKASKKTWEMLGMVLESPSTTETGAKAVVYTVNVVSIKPKDKK